MWNAMGELANGLFDFSPPRFRVIEFSVILSGAFILII
jgi:hypothetical protein